MTVKQLWKPTAFVLTFLAGALLVYSALDRKAHNEAFKAVFGISVPQTEQEREMTMPIVQAELARLETLAGKPLELPPTDIATLSLGSAALQRWLGAKLLAESEKLTREDQIDEVLRQVGNSIKGADAIVKGLADGERMGAGAKDIPLRTEVGLEHPKKAKSKKRPAP